jgi:hypothetical protein
VALAPVSEPYLTMTALPILFGPERSHAAKVRWYSHSQSKTVPAEAARAILIERLAMTVKKLLLQCACGRPTSRIRQIGLTAEHELLVAWWCRACKRHVYAAKRLADCLLECPPRESADDLPEAMEVTSSDAQFLRSLGILSAEPES